MNAMAPTRTFRRQAMPWEPLPYQLRAVEHLVSHYRAGLPLRPGGRKTSITLAAFTLLHRAHRARTMLVIAPKRVARDVWSAEIEKWDDFRHLRYSKILGDARQRRKALDADADVYLINYDNIQWLTKLYAGRPLPFDVIVFDELTKMQNASAQRHKALLPRLPGGGWRWGLTGSLFAKGHMSIFGQQLILDNGAALGRFITHYRDKYFTVGFNGFDYDLMPGAEQRIVQALAPYWFHMDDADYAQLPPLVDVPHFGDMEPQQKALYQRLKRDALISIGADTITAANAGAVYSKLAQLANGAIYRDGHTAADDYIEVHDIKLEMLEDLLDELDGEPLLLGYEFQHDVDRIQKRFGARFGGRVPFFGKGATSRQEQEWKDAWNRGELPLLMAHPQSAGHGLNLQEGQAYNVAWFGVTWDWELYDQFIRRVRRDGNEQARIFNHLFIIRGTIDEEKLSSIADKDFTERRLMTALNNQTLREAQGPTEVTTMVAKLSRPSEGGQQQGGNAPAGWGGGQAATQQQQQPAPQLGNAPAGWGGATGTDQTQEQRGRIQTTIAPPDNRAAEAANAFSGGIAAQAGKIAEEFSNPTQGNAPAGWGGGQAGGTTVAEAPPKAKRSRAKAESEGDSDVVRLQYETALVKARAIVIAAVIADSGENDSPDDLVETAQYFMQFVTEG